MLTFPIKFEPCTDITLHPRLARSIKKISVTSSSHTSCLTVKVPANLCST